MTANRDTLRVTVAVCGVGAALAVVVGLSLGSWRVGVAVALGLLIGAGNGFMVQAALSSEAGFRATSLGRMLLLSVLGIGLGALLGLPYVAPVILGIAAAQLVLAVVSGVSAVRA